MPLDLGIIIALGIAALCAYLAAATLRQAWARRFDAMSPLQRRRMILGAVMPLLLGTLFLCASVWGYVRALPPTDWPSVSGEHLQTKLIKRDSTTGMRKSPGGSSYFTYRFLYEYSVGDVTYRSDVYSYDFTSWLRTEQRDEAIRKIQTEFAPWTPVTVFYNPADPNEAALDTTVNHSFHILLITASLMVIVFGVAQIFPFLKRAPHTN